MNKYFKKVNKHNYTSMALTIAGLLAFSSCARTGFNKPENNSSSPSLIQSDVSYAIGYNYLGLKKLFKYQNGNAVQVSNVNPYGDDYIGKIYGAYQNTIVIETCLQGYLCNSNYGHYSQINKTILAIDTKSKNTIKRFDVETNSAYGSTDPRLFTQHYMYEQNFYYFQYNQNQNDVKLIKYDIATNSENVLFINENGSNMSELSSQGGYERYLDQLHVLNNRIYYTDYNKIISLNLKTSEVKLVPLFDKEDNDAASLGQRTRQIVFDSYLGAYLVQASKSNPVSESNLFLIKDGQATALLSSNETYTDILYSCRYYIENYGAADDCSEEGSLATKIMLFAVKNNNDIYKLKMVNSSGISELLTDKSYIYVNSANRNGVIISSKDKNENKECLLITSASVSNIDLSQCYFN